MVVQNGNFLTIKESGVDFGLYHVDDCYLIESSNGFKKLGDNFKTVEFSYIKNSRIYFVEAKSSIPRPISKDDYEGFWLDIITKIEHSLLLQMMACSKVNKIAMLDLPVNHQAINWGNIKIHLRLVIPEVPTDLLPGMTDVFRQKAKMIKRMWQIPDGNIFVINKQKGQREGLII